MTQKLLAVIGALALLVLVGSATMTPQGPTGPTGPKPISEIPATQHFSVYLGAVGNVYGTGTGPPQSTMSPGVGLAITQLTSRANNDVAVPVAIAVDGLTVFQSQVLPAAGISSLGGGPIRIDPPIIVPPGATLLIGRNTNYTGVENHLTLTGYWLTLEDLGM